MTAADCDDGDPCNGAEACTNGTCLASRAVEGCTPGDPIAAITSFDDDVVALVNVRTRAVDGTVEVGRGPWGVAWSPDGATLYVTNRKSRSVSVVDVATRTVVGTVAVGAQPLGIAVHPFLPRAYVTSYDQDRLAVVDTKALTVVDTVRVGNGPAGVAVHPAGAEIYVANYIAGTVSVIDAATNSVVATVDTPALPVGIAMAPDETKAYVACLRARSVAIIGTVSHSLLGTIRVGRQPIGVAFAPTARAYVTNSGDDTITVIDTATDRAIAKVPVGKFPLGVDVTADGTVFVAEGKSHDVALLDGDGVGIGAVPTPSTPVAIGRFIGTPPGNCPTNGLVCDDANPYTGDACVPGTGCTTTPIDGLPGVRSGLAAILEIIEQAGPDDPLASAIASELGQLESALAAAETSGDRASIQLVRRALKPILKTLQAGRRHGTLGGRGARLLDIVLEARAELRRLGRQVR